MTAIVIGASTGLGRALAVELANRGRPSILVSSDIRDLEPIAADLRIRFGVSAWCLEADARDVVRFAETVRDAVPPSETIEGILFPIGLIDPGDDDMLPTKRAKEILAVNFLAVASVIGGLLPRLRNQGSGTLVGFGSVAAVRGRSRNVAYSASKRALQSLFESLRHAEESHGIAVTFYCLGYMNTSMAYGQRLPFPPISPASVAERVVRRLGRDTGTRFVPRYWRWVAMVLRALPWWIFGRLRF